MSQAENEPLESLAWARALVDERAWVIHQPTCTVGRVVKLHAAGGTYTSPINQEPVQDPVLELEEGHALVARPGTFIKLSEADANFYSEAQGAIRELLTAMVMVAAGSKIPKTMTQLLLRSALQAQLLKLGAG